MGTAAIRHFVTRGPLPGPRRFPGRALWVLACLIFLAASARGQFSQFNFRQPKGGAQRVDSLFSHQDKPVRDDGPAPGANQSGEEVPLGEEEIVQAGFFPPERSLFPDTSPGKVIASPEDGPLEPAFPWVWGGVGARGIPVGQKMAPNGVSMEPIFSLDMEINIALCRDRSAYVFSATRFWGQEAAPGITTNQNQGTFDFSKREFDLTLGLAWNYWRNFEIRGFAYSYNNLNRNGIANIDNSNTKSSGYNDGVAIEHRWYWAESCFSGFGYAPTKDLVGNDGMLFKPGWFLTGSVWVPLWNYRHQVYWNSSLIAERSGMPRMFYNDVGFAWVPFDKLPRLEFRTGSEIWCDLANKTLALYYFSFNVPF